MQRVAHDGNPPVTMSKHFCQQRWIDGPLNRPGDFQLHAHKRFRLDDLFEINSWVRCRSVTVHLGEPKPNSGYNHIMIEHDFNSLAEDSETREISNDQIFQFFEIAPHEMGRVLRLYFPETG